MNDSPAANTPPAAQARAHKGRYVRKVARKALDKAIRASNGMGAPSAGAQEFVHSARKRIKEVRAVLRLVRSQVGGREFRRENRILRQAARPLSQVRDAAVLVDALKSVLEENPENASNVAFARIVSALRSRRTRIGRSFFEDAQRHERAFGKLEKMSSRIRGWPLAKDGSAELRAGLKETYRKGRDAMAQASKSMSDETLHEWRKRVKDLRYQLELLESLWPACMSVAARHAHDLGDLLGDDHDLAVLREVLDGELRDKVIGDAGERLRYLIDRRRQDVQNSAIPLGQLLFAPSPKEFVRPLERGKEGVRKAG